MKKNLLKAKIVERFGSQSDFALYIQERESIVSQVVNGRRNIPEKKIGTWAKTLKVDQADLSQLLV